MCLNPLRILNKGYRPLDLRTSAYIDVDCGKCEMCRLNRSAGYAFRMQSEIFDKDNDCLSFFVTLTYSPDWLPILYYYDDEYNVKSVKVWNKLHVRRMHKRVRRKLQYYYGIDKDSFKFLCACERGSNRQYIDDYGHYRVAQEMPHYHLMYILYHCKSVVNIKPLPDKFYSWCKRTNHQVHFSAFFQYLLDTEWFYGHVEDLSITRSSAACTRYIAKYIMKHDHDTVLNVSLGSIYKLYDPEFAQKYSSFETRFLDRINNGESYLANLAPSPIKFQDLCPSSFSSINLGMSWLNKLDYDSFVNKLLSSISSSPNLVLVGSSKSSKISLPYYYYKKFFKQTVPIPTTPFYYCDNGRLSVENADLDSYPKFQRFDGKRFSWCLPIPVERFVQVWDNMRGLWLDRRLSTFSKTSYSILGEQVRFSQWVNKIDRSVKVIRSMLPNLNSFEYLVERFKKLPIKVRDGFSMYFSNASLSKSLNVVSAYSDKQLRSFLRSFYHFNHIEINSLTGVYKHISNVLNIYRLCKITRNYLVNEEYKRAYKLRLTGVALQDPQLLIPNPFSYK